MARPLTLAGSDEPVSRIWLGTVAFGAWGNRDRSDCIRITLAALDAGINALDTAEFYGDGESEEIVGAAMDGRRERFFLSTKWGHDVPAGSADDSITKGVEASLRRLRTDYIDLLFLHRVDAASDYGETVAALTKLVDSGKVRAIGTSMATAARLHEFHEQASEHGWEQLSCEQPPYSLFVREIEREVLPACSSLGIPVIGFAPLNGGWLSGKYREHVPAPADSRAASWPVRRERFDFERPEIARKLALVDAFREIADGAGVTLPHLALGFSLSNPLVAGVIVGARTHEQLDSLISPWPGPLPAEILSEIDALVAPGSTVDPLDIVGYATQ